MRYQLPSLLNCILQLKLVLWQDCESTGLDSEIGNGGWEGVGHISLGHDTWLCLCMATWLPLAMVRSISRCLSAKQTQRNPARYDAQTGAKNIDMQLCQCTHSSNDFATCCIPTAYTPANACFLLLANYVVVPLLESAPAGLEVPKSCFWFYHRFAEDAIYDYIVLITGLGYLCSVKM